MGFKGGYRKVFDRIQRHDVKTLIRKRVGWKIIADLLCASVDCELDHEEAAIAKSNGIKKGLGLRQGMPVSPLLSNLLLKRFDLALSKRGIKAVRYADDLIVFGDSENECRDALKFIRESLSSLQLDIPELQEGGKTSLSGPSDVVEFLGVEIRRFGSVYKLCVPIRKLAAIEEKMHEIASVKTCLKEKRNIGDVVRHLNSLTIGYMASVAVVENCQEFLNRIEAAKRKSLKAMLAELIGHKAVDNLNADRLSILGIRSFK